MSSRKQTPKKDSEEIFWRLRGRTPPIMKMAPIWSKVDTLIDPAFFQDECYLEAEAFSKEIHRPCERHLSLHLGFQIRNQPSGSVHFPRASRALNKNCKRPFWPTAVGQLTMGTVLSLVRLKLSLTAVNSPSMRNPDEWTMFRLMVVHHRYTRGPPKFRGRREGDPCWKLITPRCSWRAAIFQ